MPFLKDKKFTPIHLFILSLLVALLTFSITDFFESKKINENTSSVISHSCKIDVKRLDGLKYIKPILFVDEDCESDRLANLKNKLNNIIERHKTLGDVETASVYLRDYNFSEWMSVNEDDKYEPGSLFKVPVLIAILKMNEDNPGFLNKIVKFNQPIDIGKDVAYVSKSIQLGHSYSIKELLTYMIEYSDNNATVLLESNMNPEVLQKLFSDIGLTVPNISDKHYFFTVKEYSLFMRAIYNAGYLTIKDSEFAAELLTKCNFKDGIVKGLPKNVILAHKFGESGTMIEKQLHESAIVYLNSEPYLLTIMTKGKENQKLSQLISEISQAVYLEMKNDSNSLM